MLPGEYELNLIQLSAESGARRISHSGLVIREVGERVVELYENAVLTGKVIENLRAWASRVGRNEALRIARIHRTKGWGRGLPERLTYPESDALPATRSWCEQVRELLERAECSALTDRQREVIDEVMPELSLRENARLLCMAPYSLRRMLKCIARRLAGHCHRLSQLDNRAPAPVDT